MLEGHETTAWNHTSHILALIANIFRDPKSQPFTPADFHPYAQPNTITVKDLARLIEKGTPHGQ